MSNERSPREVCSITIGTSGFTRAPPPQSARARAPARRRRSAPPRPRPRSRPRAERRSRPAAPARRARRSRPRAPRPRAARGRRRAPRRRRRGSGPRRRARGRRGCRTRIRSPARRGRRARGGGRSRPRARRRARRRRTGRSAERRPRPAKPSSRRPAGAPRLPRPARSARSSFVRGEPRENRLARETPLLSDLATRQHALLGELDDRLLLDLQQSRKLRRCEDLELGGGPERVLPDRPLRVRDLHRTGDLSRPDRVLGIELGDELRDQLALRPAQDVGSPVELLGFGRRDPHVQRGVVLFTARSRHRRYLDIKKISPSASRYCSRYWSTWRDCWCASTLRFTRWSALSIVFVSQPSWSAIVSYDSPSR